MIMMPPKQRDASHLRLFVSFTSSQALLLLLLAALLISTLNISASLVMSRGNDKKLRFDNDDNNSHPVIYYDTDDARGDAQPVHIVLSHCAKPLDWVWKHYLYNMNANGRKFNVKSISILSKCGVPLKRSEVPVFRAADAPNSSRVAENGDPPKPPPVVSVLSLPNVGRCDHSYAYWIKSILSLSPPSSPPSSYTGDTDQQQDTRSMLRHSTINGNPDDEDQDGDDDDDDDDKENSDGIVHTVVYSNTDGDPLERIAKDIKKTDVVLFMKDNDNKGRSNLGSKLLKLSQLFERMLYKNRTINIDPDYPLTRMSPDEANGYAVFRGFACGEILQDRFVNWSHRSIAWHYTINKYTPPHANNTNDYFQSPLWPMGTWIRNLAVYDFPDFSTMDQTTGKIAPAPADLSTAVSHGIFSEAYLNRAVRAYNTSLEIPNRKHSRKYNTTDLAPMCFMGVFSTVWGQISSEDAAVTPRGWKAIAHALTRTDNLEEGHYMERWWADLLSWSSYASGLNGGEKRDAGDVLTSFDISRILEYKEYHFEPDYPLSGILRVAGEKPVEKILNKGYEIHFDEHGRKIWKRKKKKKPKPVTMVGDAADGGSPTDKQTPSGKTTVAKTTNGGDTAGKATKTTDRAPSLSSSTATTTTTTTAETIR